MTEPLTFDPISRKTVSAQIREQLLQRITTGELGPGTRVPSERELSEQFEVARTSVREAIQGLLSLGFIERRGNRTWVAERLPEFAVRGGDNERVFVRQLFETRRLLEVPIFALAAERSDEQDHEYVAAVLERFDTSMSVSEFRSLDREFHTAIASSCGNPLLIELYGKVLDQLFQSAEFDTLLSDERNATAVARIVAEAIEGHRAIVEAFTSSDAKAMEVAVAGHLDAIEHSMIADLNVTT
jgi:GntR family transcriptional repressor for pyruvate dehydrogenase complex